MTGKRLWLLLVGLALLVACRPGTETVVPTPVAAAPTVAGATATAPVALPPTFTPAATATLAPAGTRSATSAPRPTRTPLVLPTRTPIPPSATATPLPTNTTTPTPTASATPPSAPAGASNLLPNPSFEQGWYHINGIPELQVPNRWALEWETGTNPLDPDPWNAWVRPESRVLPADQLPAHEHDLFIWDGQHTVKVFKGTGAISFRLLTTVYLAPGTYLFEINVFPDLVDEYTRDGEKVWAPDPLSGEVRFLVDGNASGWELPAFGRKNTLTHTFTVAEGHEVRLGAAFRGRWAILNNGWFLDDWSLLRVGA